MSLKSFVLLDEKGMLDLICKEYKLNRDKASINVNFVEDDHKNSGSWTVQVQAPQEPERIHREGPHNLTIEFKAER